MTLKLPETLTRLPEAERDLLIRAGLHEATRARILQLNAELAEAKKQVRRFETRYALSLVFLSLKSWRNRIRSKRMRL